jgi:LDH2 family malate/lactate/ureidoglycolate dehydrogenase
MQIRIEDAKKLAHTALSKYGFSDEEIKYCTENCLDGELTEKKSHGFIRIPLLIKKVKEEKISVGDQSVEVVKETPTSLLIDGKKKTGLYVVNKALELGIEKVKELGLLAIGITNTAPISGLIGQYARLASENNLIFIGFNNSPGGLVPFGAIEEVFGTNPVTVGIPTKDLPFVLDMASSKKTWGDLLIAHAKGTNLPDGVAIDGEGNVTIDPEKAMEGGLLPIAEHKGSGLAFVVELLGGALTRSRCGNNLEGGWGTFFILIDPNILLPLDEFKDRVDSLIKEVKSLPKAKGVKEIYYPGERSQRDRAKKLKEGKFELSDKIYDRIKDLIDE